MVEYKEVTDVEYQLKIAKLDVLYILLSLQSSAHQTIYFDLCTALNSRALAPILNSNCIT
jgi:hypothetical protein